MIVGMYHDQVLTPIKTLVEYNDKDLLIQCVRQCFHDPKKFWPLLENAHELLHNSKFDDYKLVDLYRYT